MPALTASGKVHCQYKTHNCTVAFVVDCAVQVIAPVMAVHRSSYVIINAVAASTFICLRGISS
jgi:hypothetical protein